LKFKTAIPNAITAGNMIFGLVAIMISLRPWYYIEYAYYCILLAAVCDMFDGLIARMLRVQSEFGKQFDSHCDMVSFGVAPAIIASRTVQMYSSPCTDSLCPSLMVYAAPAIFALAVGIRLAIFNNDTRQTKDFRGLPSPAAGLFLACTSLFWVELFGAENVILVIVVASLAFAALMLIPFPLQSLKFHNSESKILAVVLLLLAVPMFIFLGWAAIAPVIISYLVASPLIRYFAKLFSEPAENNLS